VPKDANVLINFTADLGEVRAYGVEVRGGSDLQNSQPEAGEPVTEARLLGPGTLAGQPPGTLAVPVRLADPTTTGIVSTGDHVDVIAGTAADVAGLEPGPPDADVVAWDVVVLATPGQRSGAPGGSGSGWGALTGGSGDEATDADGLLVVATDRATAVRLARAQAGKALSVAVRGSPDAVPPPP